MSHETVSGEEFAGAVQIIYGSTGGLSATAGPGAQQWSQDSSNIQGGAERGDQFGYALAAGDFDGDRKTDLAIGVVCEAVWFDTCDGAVNVLYGGENAGLTASRNQFWSQASSGIEGSPEQHGDQFGASLTAWNLGKGTQADLAIGVPFEDVTPNIPGCFPIFGCRPPLPVPGAGAINVIYGSATGLTSSGDQIWSQDSEGVPGGLEDFDYFGWTIY